ncbi:hypothetical protein Hanom_Chr06g00576221 [Helianthus anomalus]
MYHVSRGYFSTPVWHPQVPGDKPIYPSFFVWVISFVLPWTHQESGASSRPVVRSSFAQLGTYTSSLTLTPSPIKSRTSQ